MPPSGEFASLEIRSGNGVPLMLVLLCSFTRPEQCFVLEGDLWEARPWFHLETISAYPLEAFTNDK